MAKTGFNLESINRSLVPAEYSLLRIDRYLAGRFSYLSRTGWQNEIRNGKVYHNGLQLFNYHKKVKAGDEVQYISEERYEPQVNRNYSILYEDEYLMVINKPPDLPVHPAGIYYRNTLLSILTTDLGMGLHPVHRLDRETSGAVIMSKCTKTASFIQSNFHMVKKTYHAIVHGIMEADGFDIIMPIGNDAGSAIRKKRAAYPEAGETAETSFRRLHSIDGYTLVEALPVTGRQHQIRVHLKYAGFPILGDKLYGLDENYFLEFIEKGNDPDLIRRIGFGRCALHSRSVHFYHPGLKEEIHVEAPLPEDMRNFMNEKMPSPPTPLPE